VAEENEEKVVELGFLETPKDPVARFEDVKQLAELLVEVQEELESLKKKLEEVRRIEKTTENLETRLKTIEDQLVVMSGDMHEILNASGELSATVAQLKKALKL
jgi:uncharacterized protein (DUF3084 family)